MAGVPPDYFSATGQLWGNPIFDWDEMKKRGFAWWTDRMRNTLSLVDLVRIDHFRGFEAFWQVPADEKTAVNGEWIEGPGDGMFDALRDALGEVPVVAENLGLITEKVEALRKRCGFPGMAVLQFAFGPDAKHSGLLPHKWTRDMVVYTGTPDNDTTVGWWNNTGKNTMDNAEFDRVRAYAKKYLDTDGADIPKMALRTVMSSVAATTSAVCWARNFDSPTLSIYFARRPGPSLSLSLWPMKCRRTLVRLRISLRISLSFSM